MTVRCIFYTQKMYLAVTFVRNPFSLQSELRCLFGLNSFLI